MTTAEKLAFVQKEAEQAECMVTYYSEEVLKQQLRLRSAKQMVAELQAELESEAPDTSDPYRRVFGIEVK